MAWWIVERATGNRDSGPYDDEDEAADVLYAVYDEDDYRVEAG